MEIIRTNSLNSKQKKEISAIVQACQKECGTALSFPMEENSFFYLLYAPLLVSALSLEQPEPGSNEEDSLLECRAFTAPDFQRKGYFSALLEAACEDAGERELLFAMDHTSVGAIFTLTSLGAELMEDHYKMELDLADFDEAEVEKRLFMTTVSSENTFTATFYLKEHTQNKKATPVGTAGAACFEHSVCLHDFELSPSFRGQGLGGEALSLFLRHCRESGFSSLFLHVSGDNTPAVNLYKKTGLRITETLSFYLY